MKIHFVSIAIVSTFLYSSGAMALRWTPEALDRAFLHLCAPKGSAPDEPGFAERRVLFHNFLRGPAAFLEPVVKQARDENATDRERTWAGLAIGQYCSLAEELEARAGREGCVAQNGSPSGFGGAVAYCATLKK